MISTKLIRIKVGSQIELVSAIEKRKIVEKVLILQGGGSLGAFGCGVFKAIEKHGIQLDIVAGTSIGGINAAIIAGTKETGEISRKLEEFWIELSEGFIQIGLSERYTEYRPFDNFFENIFFPSPKNSSLPNYLT